MTEQELKDLRSVLLGCVEQLLRLAEKGPAAAGLSHHTCGRVGGRELKLSLEWAETAEEVQDRKLRLKEIEEKFMARFQGGATEGASIHVTGSTQPWLPSWLTDTPVELEGKVLAVTGSTWSAPQWVDPVELQVKKAAPEPEAPRKIQWREFI